MVTHLANKLNTKEIPLSVQRVESNVWKDLGFNKHHYMSANLSKSAKCFLFSWNSLPVGFVAILNQTFRGCNKNDHRISRIVIHPNYQGLGFSGRILNFMGGLIKSLGGNLYIKTVHTKMGKYLEKSHNWEATAYNGKQHLNNDPKSNRLTRISYCFKYCGDPIYGYEYLLTPVNELRSSSKKDEDEDHK